VRRRPELVLLALWACFVARGLFYSALLPLWEGYDEYSHFAYVQHVVTHGSIPVPGVSRISPEIAASLKDSPVPWIRRDEFPGAISYDRFWALSPAERQARSVASQIDPPTELLYEAQQPPLYYWILSPFLHLVDGWSLTSRVFVLRLMSILIASAALPFGLAIARRVFGDARIAAAVIAVATCMPEAFINFARVGNESLAVFFYTLLAWACLRVLDRGPSLRDTALVAIALAGGLLTKVYFLTAIPVVCIVYLLIWRRANVSFRLTALHATAALTLAALPSLWWYRFIYQATGDFTGQIQSVALRTVPWTDRISAALHLNWLRALDTAMLSHIWFGAWSFLQVRSWIYHLFYAIGLAAAAGLFVVALRRRADRQPLVILALFEVCLAASLAYQVTLSQIAYNAPMTCGWYFYCLMFAEVILICAGLRALLPIRARAWATPSLAALFALLDVYGVHFILLPYYAGVVAHTPAGRLPVFRLSHLATTGLGEISARLGINPPFLLSPVAFWFLWGMYWIATITCVVIAIRSAWAWSSETSTAK
jgi:4-amino-4-deoxy-L-arabinose transferase-like glycosyltransferase